MQSQSSSRRTSKFRPPVQLVKGEAFDRMAGLLGPAASAELLAIVDRLSKETKIEPGHKLHACPTCGKRAVVDTVSMFVKDPVTGLNVMDPRCSDCRKNTKEACPVVCHNCKEMFLWMDPGPKAFGYVAVPGRFLHTPACPTCLDLFMEKKGVQVDTPILEFRAAYCSEKGIDFSVWLRDWFSRLEERRNVVNQES